MRPGQSFEQADVAEFYVHRPEYPTQIFAKLVEISPAYGSLLDLGCGTGKIARRLARQFMSVTAVDASLEMLRIAKALAAKNAHNITWLHGLAEFVELVGAPFDLVVAAASIDWMDHSILVPRLRAVLRPDHVVAIVNGDGAFEPPWQDAWEQFLKRWVLELKGEAYDPGSYAARTARYGNWLDVVGEIEVVSAPIEQSAHDFIACQHSRDTFAPSKLGARMREFDEELARILDVYEEEGMLTFSVKTRLVWGSIRT